MSKARGAVGVMIFLGKMLVLDRQGLTIEVLPNIISTSVHTQIEFLCFMFRILCQIQVGCSYIVEQWQLLNNRYSQLESVNGESDLRRQLYGMQPLSTRLSQQNHLAVRFLSSKTIIWTTSPTVHTRIGCIRGATWTFTLVYCLYYCTTCLS